MRLNLLDRHDARRSGGGGGGNVLRSRSDSGLFWWTILITVLIGLASFCWFFSIYVFAHPEKPMNYELLTKLDKLEEVRDFSPTNVPGGMIASGKELYAKFYDLSPTHLQVQNALLKRNFISNYEDEAPIYLTGIFEVLSTRMLSEKDLVPSGCVVRGRCLEFPNVDIEYIVPASSVNVIPFAKGDSFKVSGSGHYASVVHVDRFSEDKICFSMIPLLYPELSNVREKGAKPLLVVMSAPQKLNMAAELPLTNAPGKEISKVARLSR